MKHLIGWIVVLCSLAGQAQPYPAPPYTIGDAVPDVTIPNIIGYSDATIRLAQLRGKLVILDFMATNCVSCLEALPSMDSLQQQFGARLQILFVTTEGKEKVRRFFQNNKMAR